MGHSGSKDGARASAQNTNMDLTVMATGVGNLNEDVTQDQLEAFFTKWASNTEPKNLLHRDDFVRVCEEINIGLSVVEVRRMFDNMCEHSDGLTFEQFKIGVRRWRLLSTIASNYNVSHTFRVPDNYDFTKTTNENYGCSLDDGFLEENALFRKALDYKYHTNYKKERQVWQDEAIRSVVVRTQSQARPWLVYTSGPPGAGKTYALSWMSQHGYFPLENIVRVDPDYFKKIMPEWDGYVKEDPDTAATRCHRESAFFAELAQTKAMHSGQHVWVDTTLKEYEWFANKFAEYRHQYPQYRIAIFYITAPREKILQRVAERAAKTGRAVPESLVQFALEGLPRALEALTPRVDFVARISNERDGAAPELQAVQVVDGSGQWNIIRQNFAHTQPGPTEFPYSFAPVFIESTNLKPQHFLHLRVNPRDLPGSPRKYMFYDPDRSCIVLDPSVADVTPTVRNVLGLVTGSMSCSGIGGIQMCTSPTFPVNLDKNSRKLANIPEDAHSFNFLYPCLTNDILTRLRGDMLMNSMVLDPVCQLLQNGGFAYFDLQDQVVAVNAVTVTNKGFMLQFGPPRPLPPKATKLLAKSKRWHPVTIEYMLSAGAERFAWILPGEKMPTESISRFGAFAFQLRVAGKANNVRNVYFPVAADSWEF